MSDIKKIKDEFLLKLSKNLDLNQINQIKTDLFGKNGLVSSQFKQLGKIAEEERKKFASDLNQTKEELQNLITNKINEIDSKKINEKLEKEKIDVTLPERSFVRGKIHPVSQTIDEISSIFSEIGFSVEEGPDIENEYNNFTALNTPDNHPARDMHDTFYLDEKKEILLRTHTSPVQIRTMLKDKPPFKIIAPGRTYRSDSDQTHAPMFHQVEGLHIDKDINMGHLKGCLNYFIKGKIHPVSQTIDEISSIFSEIGFSVEEGPDIENEYNNFTALNTPDNHPARDMHDTFYLDENKETLLRTHTSPVQIRTMLKDKPPFKIIAPGRTYRSDSDQTHAPMFHQVEGLHIDKDINMGHLKGCLNYLIKEFFEVEKIKMRFRPSHFPFTEPSAEVDIGYEIKDGKIVIGEGDQWLEILGCGMVHPNVLKNVKVDPSKYQGYAFGIGIDRLAMLKYGINDLRAFFDCDYRWLNHFGFDPLDVPTNYRGLSR